MRCLLLLALSASVASAAPPATNVSVAYALLERLIPNSSSHFALSIASGCAGIPAGQACFTLSDAGSKVAIAGTTVSEVTAAIGVYLREYANMTLGWPRGGGSNVFLPTTWPAIGAPVVRARIVPYSYIMNVCTHSYSLVWYSWDDWTRVRAVKGR